MSAINAEILRLAADLLDLASETYSNFGCNDFDLDEHVSDPRVRNLLVKIAYGDSEFEREEYLHTTPLPGKEDYRLGDYAAMSSVAHILRTEAGAR